MQKRTEERADISALFYVYTTEERGEIPMSNEIFKLFGTIAISNSEANEAIDETTGKASSAHKKLSGLFGNVGKIALGAGKVIAAGVGATATAFTALGASAVKYNAQMEQYNTSFEVMLGSEEKALALVADLKEKAAKTPFEMSDLANTTQLLLNYGLTAEEATEKMMMLGDIAQGDAQKMERVANAYGQMSSAGKVSLEDVKQMIEAGFNPLQEISESTGESMASLYDRISKGTISVDEITASMTRATSEGGKYFQSMEKQSQTFSGRLSTLKDTIDSKLGEAFAGVSDVLSEKVLPLFTSMAEQYIPKLGTVVEQIIPPLLSVGESVLPMVMSVLESMIPLCIQTIETILPLLVSTLGAVLPVLIQLANSVMPVLLTMLVNSIPQLLPLIEEILPIMADLLMILVPLLAEFLPTALGYLIPLLMEMANFIKIYLVPGIEILAEWLGPVLGDTIKSLCLAVEGVYLMFKGTFDSIIGIVEFFIAIFTGDWQGAGEAFLKIWKGVLDFWIGLFQSIMPGLIVWIQNTWNKVVTFMKDVGFDAIKNLIDGIVNKAKDIPSKVIEIGKNIVAGVWNGIQAAKDEFMNNIGNFFGGIVEGAKNVLDIHSPSKKFEWIGEMCVSGYEKGAEPLTDGTAFENVALAGATQATVNDIGASNGIDYDRMTQCFVKALQTVAPELRSNVTVEGDAKGMFKTIQKQAKVFKDTTGQGAFA